VKARQLFAAPEPRKGIYLALRSIPLIGGGIPAGSVLELTGPVINGRASLRCGSRAVCDYPMDQLKEQP
jgi:hypothetical protein